MDLPRIRISLLSSAVLALFMSGSLGAALLTFDDLTPTGTFSQIPNGYGDLNWSTDFYYINRALHPGSGYDLGTVSGDYVAFNAFDSEVSVDSGTFTLDSAYFTSAWDASQTLHIEGWLAGSLAYSVDLTIVNTGPTFHAFGWTVDEVRFDSLGEHWLMDDLAVTGANLPDGGTSIALLGLALLGLGLGRRFRC